MEVLGDVEYEHGREAIVEFLKTDSAFAPVPGQILAIVNEKRMKRAREAKPQIIKDFEIPRDSFKGNLRDMLTPDGLKRLLKLTGEKQNV